MTESSVVSSLSTITIPFTEKGMKADPKSGNRAVTVSSKTTKDDEGNKIPPKFQPFTVILPSSYLEPISKLPEVFQDVSFEALDSLIRDMASSRKLAGNNSIILQNNCEKEFRLATQSVRVTIATMGKWFDEFLVPIFQAEIAIPEKLQKVIGAYRAAFCNSVNNQPSDRDLEKLLAWAGKVQDEGKLTTAILEHLTKMVHIEDNLSGLE